MDEPEFVLYRYFEGDHLLYIGLSQFVVQRLVQHRGTPWWRRADRITLERLPDRKALYRAETEAIKNENPEFNYPRTRGRGLSDEVTRLFEENFDRSQREFAAMLNTLGFTTPTGLQWSSQSVYGWRNRLRTGDWRFSKPKN